MLTVANLPAQDAAPVSDGARQPEALKRLEADLQAMFGPCSEATVSIVASAKGKTGSGSGVVVSDDGLILTAAHVLDGLGDEATVFFPDGRMVRARLLGSDFDRDAAMLQIMKEGSYPHVDLSKGPELAIDQWCAALGHPGGFDPERPPVLRLGRVLASGDFILTSCTVVGGDSGGPLFDVQGRLIGIHSSIGFGLKENRHVPVNVFRDSWDRLKAGERYGNRFASSVDEEKPEAPAVFGEVDADGKDDLDRFLDESLKPTNGQAQLRLTPEVLKRFGGMDTIMRRLKARSVPKADQEAEGKKTTAEKPEAKPAAPVPKVAKSNDGDEAATGLELIELMNKARENGTEMEVTPELLSKMGGMEGLMKQLKSLGLANDGTQPSGTRLPAELKVRDPFMEKLLGELKGSAEAASSCVATLMAGKTPQSLATVVAADGYLVAPILDPEPGEIAVHLGDRVLAAKVVKHYPQHGLTLLKAEADGLPTVTWVTSAGMAEVGTLVTVPSPGGRLFGLGVVGVKERNTIDTPFLGIGAAEAEDGVLVNGVGRRSPAETAGILTGDVIRTIAGRPVRKETLSKVLKQFSAGDTVELALRRGEENLTLCVKLLPSLYRMQSERLRVMNSMSGPVSSQGSGFVRALQHDIALAPRQCGGPLLDLDGGCIGINVSRAGRVETLAVPAATVIELIKGDIAP